MNLQYKHNTREWIQTDQYSQVLHPERERGQWDVYNISPQSFIITLSYSLTSGTLVNFDWLTHQFKCSCVTTTNFNFVYHHSGQYQFTTATDKRPQPICFLEAGAANKSVSRKLGMQCEEIMSKFKLQTPTATLSRSISQQI